MTLRWYSSARETVSPSSDLEVHWPLMMTLKWGSRTTFSLGYLVGHEACCLLDFFCLRGTFLRCQNIRTTLRNSSLFSHNGKCSPLYGKQKNNFLGEARKNKKYVHAILDVLWCHSWLRPLHLLALNWHRKRETHELNIERIVDTFAWKAQIDVAQCSKFTFWNQTSFEENVKWSLLDPLS